MPTSSASRFASRGSVSPARRTSDRRRAVDHVGVGEDLTVGRDDHSGAERMTTLHVGADRDDRRRDVIDDAAHVDAPLARVTRGGDVERRVRRPRRGLVHPVGDPVAQHRAERAGDERDAGHHGEQDERPRPVRLRSPRRCRIGRCRIGRWRIERRSARTDVRSNDGGSRRTGRRRAADDEVVVGGDDGVGADHGDGADIGDMPSCLPIPTAIGPTRRSLTPVSQLLGRGTGGPAGPPVHGVRESGELRRSGS